MTNPVERSAADERVWRSGHGVTVLIPCYNEAVTIAKVIEDFKRELPAAEIVVYDNNSTDDTARIAREHGATVRREVRQGKGFVIAGMFRRELADYFVMVDGDDTYEAASVHDLLRPVVEGDADMTVGARLKEFSETSFRRFHVFGNNLVRSLINTIFRSDLTDIMSGYRAYTAEVAQCTPVVASGFEVETEMTLQMLYHHFVIKEVTTPYRERPAGSYSKLNTFSDGIRVIFKILGIFKSAKPLTFFGLIGIFFFLIGMMLGAVVIYEYLVYSYIFRVPTAILAASCVLLSFFSVSVGLILHTVNFRMKELYDVLRKMHRAP